MRVAAIRSPSSARRQVATSATRLPTISATRGKLRPPPRSVICRLRPKGHWGMDRERAEAHLRLLGRGKSCGAVPTAAGVLDGQVADQILGDFELALDARQAGSPRPGPEIVGAVTSAGGAWGQGLAGSSARAGDPGPRRGCQRRGVPALVRAAGVRPAIQPAGADRPRPGSGPGLGPSYPFWSSSPPPTIGGPGTG